MKSIKQIQDDLHLFIEIQVSKYLVNAGKSQFNDENELAQTAEIIMKAYNEKIASDHLRLDNLSPDSKVKWFESVEIDWSLLQDEPDSEDMDDDLLPEDEEEVEEMRRWFYKHFPSLPDNSFEIFFTSLPALKKAGIPSEKLVEILHGRKPNRYEEDMFYWGLALTSQIIYSQQVKGKAARIKAARKAMEIASQSLSKEDAEDVINEMKSIFDEIVEG